MTFSPGSPYVGSGRRRPGASPPGTGEKRPGVPDRPPRRPTHLTSSTAGHCNLQGRPGADLRLRKCQPDSVSRARAQAMTAWLNRNGCQRKARGRAAPGRMAQNGCGVTPVKYLRPVYMSVMFMGASDALSAVYFTWQRRAGLLAATHRGHLDSKLTNDALALAARAHRV